jgi:hypothetical protein
MREIRTDGRFFRLAYWWMPLQLRPTNTVKLRKLIWATAISLSISIALAIDVALIAYWVLVLGGGYIIGAATVTLALLIGSALVVGAVLVAFSALLGTIQRLLGARAAREAV